MYFVPVIGIHKQFIVNPGITNSDTRILMDLEQCGMIMGLTFLHSVPFNVSFFLTFYLKLLGLPPTELDLVPSYFDEYI